MQNFFCKDAEYPSSYQIIQHYISLTAQFFKVAVMLSAVTAKIK